MTPRRPDPRITLIVDYMHRELAQPLSAPQLCGLVNLSSSRFRALFAAQAGEAPLPYPQRLRLSRAALLVARTYLPVKEVMAPVGYNDPSHFARDCRREHGAPPSSFRRDELVTPMPARTGPSVNPPTHSR